MYIIDGKRKTEQQVISLAATLGDFETISEAIQVLIKNGYEVEEVTG